MGWYNGAWPYRKKLTINVAQVAGALTNYPALVSLGNDADLLDAQYDGDDFLFTSSDGTTKLSHEIVTFDPIAQADGCWTFFTRPTAVYYAGTKQQTYIGYVNSAGDVVAAAYNHATQAWTTFTLVAGLEVNDHAAPSVWINPNNGKVVYFYSKQGDTGNQFRYRMSSSAEDISAFELVRTVATSGINTYTQPVYLSANDTLYMFYRAYESGVADKIWKFNTITAATFTAGAAWDGEVKLWGPAAGFQYLHAVANGTDRIDFVGCNNSPNVAATSLYHWYMQIVGGVAKWYQSDGTEIALPAGGLAPADVTLVYDGSVTRAWNWDIAIDASGNPVIAYASFASTSDHRYNVTRWNGSAWTSGAGNQVCAGGKYIYVQGTTAELYYSGGMCLDHADPDTCYVSREVASDTWRLEKYTWSGAAWSLAATISPRDGKHIRPAVPRNAVSSLSVVWLGGYYDYWGTIGSDPGYGTDLWTYPHTKSATDKLVTYVKVPSLSATVDTDLYLYYGNAAATNQEDAANVWDANYLAVWHGRDKATDTRKLIETIGAKNGTKPAASALTDTVEFTGKIARSQRWGATVASNRGIDLGTQINFANLTQMHLEAWLYYGAQDATTFQRIWNAHQVASTTANLIWAIKNGTNHMTVGVIVQADTEKPVGLLGEITDLELTPGAWQWVELLFNTTNLRAAMNTTVSAVVVATGAAMDAGATVQGTFGNSAFAARSLKSFGRMESIRLSNIVRSDDWRTTQYANQNDPATFWTVGSEEARPAAMLLIRRRRRSYAW